MNLGAETVQALVTVEDIHTYYGKSHILHGSAEARWWASSAATASARARR